MKTFNIRNILQYAESVAQENDDEKTLRNCREAHCDLDEIECHIRNEE